MRLRGTALLGVAVLLLAACESQPDTIDDEPASDESTDDVAEQTTDDADTDANSESNDEDEEEADVEDDAADLADPGEDAANADADAEDEAGDNRLAIALATVDEVVDDDFDVFDDHCAPLSAWSNVEAALADHLEDNQRQDGGYERAGDQMLQFNCGFGWHAEDEGFGSLAVLVTVQRDPIEVPASFEEASTPAGMPALIGQGDIDDDLTWSTGDPVNAAVAVVEDHELRATSLVDALEPEELLAVLDAAWEDLGEVG